MGGKTIVLKTVGLAVAMAHAALPVVGRRGQRVPLDRRDRRGPRRRAVRGPGTLDVRRAPAAAQGAWPSRRAPRTLLLADELGAGTDPEEGAALGRALVEHFAARGAWGVLTTHLGSLKRVAGEVAGVVNGSLEFDRETLTPRFRFLAGHSRARATRCRWPSRLGFPPALLERASALTPDETRALERLLAEVGDALRAAGEERAALARPRARGGGRRGVASRAPPRTRARTLAELRRALTAESEALLARARELWQTMQREARRADKSRARRGRAPPRHRGGRARRRRRCASASPRPRAPSPAARRCRASRSCPGRRVRVADLGIEAEVASAPDAEGRVQLRRGSWSIQSHVNRLAAPEPRPRQRAPRRDRATFAPAEETPRARGGPARHGGRRGAAGGGPGARSRRAVRALGAAHHPRHRPGRAPGGGRAPPARRIRRSAASAWARAHEGGRGVTVATLR